MYCKLRKRVISITPDSKGFVLFTYCFMKYQFFIDSARCVIKTDTTVTRILEKRAGTKYMTFLQVINNEKNELKRKYKGKID